MPQKLVQEQEQKLQQVQVQRLSQQQMLQVRLLEMPLAELEENVAAELNDNPALEERRDDMDDYSSGDGGDVDSVSVESDTDDGSDSGYEARTEREEREEALDKALEGLGSDDAMPIASDGHSYQNTAETDYEEKVWGNTTSFYDKLKEQMGLLDLTEQEEQIMEYLIGSLDSDGLLRKPLDSIADELAIYHSVDVEEKDVERMLLKLQGFDPAGIGARSLQECLEIQIRRRDNSRLKDLMLRVVRQYFDDFTKKHWQKLQTALSLTDEQVRIVTDELRKLNPKPGAALGETMGRSTQQITPDFIVDTDDDGNVSFVIARGRVPELNVSPSFVEMVNTYRNQSRTLSRTEKEALAYAKNKVDKAQGYILAVKMRRQTLYATMKAIIDWQLRFFQDGDESDLRPMILKDIAEKTKLDKSTISRVSNEKYAQTRWGTFPLRFFFTDSYVTKDGEEISTRKIKLALKELIDNEDPAHPLSDDTLAEKMKRQNYPIARRTVTKYREQMRIPAARLRKA